MAFCCWRHGLPAARRKPDPVRVQAPGADPLRPGAIALGFALATLALSLLLLLAFNRGGGRRNISLQLCRSDG